MGQRPAKDRGVGELCRAMLMGNGCKGSRMRGDLVVGKRFQRMTEWVLCKTALKEGQCPQVVLQGKQERLGCGAEGREGETEHPRHLTILALPRYLARIEKASSATRDPSKASCSMVPCQMSPAIFQIPTHLSSPPGSFAQCPGLHGQMVRNNNRTRGSRYIIGT
jgi:hypothetical protein